MKKYLVAVAVVAVAALIAVSGSNAQQSGVDQIETCATNYVASVTTNAATMATAVLPALTAGQGQYTYIKIKPTSGAVHLGLGSAATTSKQQVDTNGWTWTLPAGSVNAGGPYRNTAIYLLNASASNDTVSVVVEAWKVVKQR